MAENMDIPFHVYAYVNPATGEVDSLYAAHLLGTLKREGGSWEPVISKEEVFNDTNGKSVYELDWDRDIDELDDLDMSDEQIAESEDEHPAVVAFDSGERGQDYLEKYFTLVNDAKAPNIEVEKP